MEPLIVVYWRQEHPFPSLFIPADNADHKHHAFAAITDKIENQLPKQFSQGIGVKLTVPPNVYATQLTPVNIKVSDIKSGSPISHVDWAISVKDPNGNVIYKTTTAHSHIGVMSFKVAFPMAGESTISMSASSICPNKSSKC